MEWPGSRDTNTVKVALLKGDFGNALLKNMMNYVTSLAWGDYKDGNYKIHNSGTAFFLNLGAATFFVTAAHVYEGYVEAKLKDPNLRCFLGSMEVDLKARCIGCLGSKRLDIATFSIELEEVEKLNKHVCYGAASWPPEKVSEGAGILIGGFPGLEREQVDAQEYSFGLYAALTPVSSSSDRHFGCVLDRAGWIDTFGQGLPPWLLIGWLDFLRGSDGTQI